MGPLCTDLLLDIDTSDIFVKVIILHCMYWLADVSRCGRFRGCGRTGWRPFVFAGHRKVVWNATIRASLLPCRTFKLVPDMRFGAELAANFSRFLFMRLTNGADFLLINFFQLLA